ncbi:MAG: MoaD/ThiS family protein [Chloroflexota bacterium]
MLVRVLLFASHRELFGQRQLELDIPSSSTPQDLFAILEERQPGLTRFRRYTAFAVNREVVGPDTELHAGDEIALLQPASGG